MDCKNWSCWKDSIDLVLKVVFVAVFSYGVMSAVCCMKSCSSSCNKQKTTCCKSAPVKQCAVDCTKSCCSK